MVKSVTINDVAKRAGVSITTVSRVINNNYPVKKETREKVEKAIEELNFQPNYMAKSLITKKTNTIGVVVPGITNLFFPTIVEKIENSIKKFNYSISLCNTGGDYKEEKKVINNLLQRRVDSIIVIDPSVKNLENGFYERLSNNIPLIVINALSKDYKCNFINYDEETGVIDSLDYFIKLKRKRIAFIRGEKSNSYDLREKIYKEYIQDNKLKYENIIKVENGNSLNVAEEVKNKLNLVLNDENMPDAIFACNDIMAVGVLNYCRDKKIRVPQDISLIGCDNTFLSNITYPKLCSVDLGVNEIGEIAVNEILDLINKSKPNTCRKKVILESKLIIRESCCKKID